jgi:hypothetical protein
MRCERQQRSKPYLIAATGANMCILTDSVGFVLRPPIWRVVTATFGMALI